MKKGTLPVSTGSVPIVAAGTDAQIQPLIGPKTEVIHLDGKLAIPGFIESHGHIRDLGLLRIRLDLTKTRSWEEVVEKVRDAAGRRRSPTRSWVGRSFTAVLSCPQRRNRFWGTP